MASSMASSSSSSVPPPLSPSVVFNSTPGVPRAHPNASNSTNPVVFLDVDIGGQPAGRVVIELFADVAPRISENFRQFCAGEARHRSTQLPLGYRGTAFHRIIRGFMAQGGDFVSGDGSGLTSIYDGDKFADENFRLGHSRAGLLSMANTGADTNGCQFFITLAPCPWLDGKHCVFGAVIDGLLTVRKMEAVSVNAANKPTLPVTIAQCGEL